MTKNWTTQKPPQRTNERTALFLKFPIGTLSPLRQRQSSRGVAESVVRSRDDDVIDVFSLSGENSRRPRLERIWMEGRLCVSERTTRRRDEIIVFVVAKKATTATRARDEEDENFRGDRSRPRRRRRRHRRGTFAERFNRGRAAGSETRQRVRRSSFFRYRLVSPTDFSFERKKNPR